MPTFLQGLLLGLSIAAPVGPIGVLCIRRTLAQGRAHGLVSGLGAATADMLYGTITALGLTTVADALVGLGPWLRLVGGAFLIYLGLRALLTRAATLGSAPASSSLGAAYASALGLTLTNPITILSFAAIFAGMGLAEGGASHGRAAALVAGVFCGSALWWLLLSSAVGLFRRRLSPAVMAWINRVAGVVLVAFGLAILVGLARQVL